MTGTGTKRGGPRSKAQWDERAPYNRISFSRYTPNVGVTIDNIDLAHVDDETVDEIRRAVAEHCVVFFRDQKLTVEEHNPHGGFGSAVAEVLMDRGLGGVKFRRLALPDVNVCKVGTQPWLIEQYGLDAKSIAAAVRGMLSRGKTRP